MSNAVAVGRIQGPTVIPPGLTPLLSQSGRRVHREKASASDYPQQDQQRDCADGRGNDGADPPGAADRRKMENVPQPAADVTADDAHYDVADQAEASSLQNFPSQPACNRADHQRDNQSLLHSDSLPPEPQPIRPTC